MLAPASGCDATRTCLAAIGIRTYFTHHDLPLEPVFEPTSNVIVVLVGMIHFTDFIAPFPGAGFHGVWISIFRYGQEAVYSSTRDRQAAASVTMVAVGAALLDHDAVR